MQFSEEWKSLFPISLVHTPPLLVSDTSLGPLFFNPVQETVNTVLTFPPQFCHLLLPPPHVSLPRFVENATLYDSGGAVLHTTSNGIASLFGPQHYNDGSCDLQNRLEPLRCPNDWVLVFFPTGANLDSVGFAVLTVKDSNVGVVDFGSHDSFFTSSVKFDHRIVRLRACRLNDCDVGDSGKLGFVGFLVACTMYGAHWFGVRISEYGSRCEKPVLEYLGSKLFKSCAVALACWNPHLPGECVILLENGDLFLFNMESSCYRGKKMSVGWNELGESPGDFWFSCEFSWHPRILIVANSKAVFLVDFRFGKCRPCCLLKTEMLGVYDTSENEQLLAFSKAGEEGFLFTVASANWLLLCDVRRPLMPVLRWAHNLHRPCYMTVLLLSELRTHPHNDKHVGSSDGGSAIVLGSFWNNEFSVFCFGHPTSATTQSISAKIMKFSDSFYAWDYPSELRLSGHCCGCGSCLLKEEFVKDDHPEWIEWQQKREVVLGFFVLDKDLSLSLPSPGEHGGFTLVRLMSSGKLEIQQYRASWKTSRSASTEYHEIAPQSKDSLLCRMGDEEYKFTRRFQYVKLEYLFSHLNNDLTRLLFTKFKNTNATGCANKCSDKFSDFMIEKLKAFGCAPPISHLSTSDVFSDVYMPISLYEVVSRLMWISLPMSSLEMAFPPSRDVPLEFPNIPDQNQAPPFFLKTPSYNFSKRSNKTTHGSDFVGPVLPLPALLVLNEISRNGYSFVTQVNDYSPETAIALKCKPVVCLAKELGVSEEDKKDITVSLGDDKDDGWVDPLNPSSLFMFEPSAFSNEFPSLNGEDPGNFLQERETLISRVAKSKSVEDGKASKLFDGLCPVELKFNSDEQAFDAEELHSYQFLKKQFAQWQHDFVPCQKLF
ncbi:hypothetical protein vseg_010514 [Gypsophila vaccaria]